MRTFTQDSPNGRPECEFGGCRKTVRAYVTMTDDRGDRFRTAACLDHASELGAIARNAFGMRVTFLYVNDGDRVCNAEPGVFCTGHVSGNGEPCERCAAKYAEQEG